MRTVSSKFYFLSFIIPILSLGSVFSQNTLIIFLPMIYTFVFIQVLDLFNPKIEVSTDKNSKSILYSVSLFYLFVWGIFLGQAKDLPVDLILIKALNVGVAGGAIGINCAHELGHSKSKISRLLANILLFSVSYTHFYIEHNKGHHKHVATPKDPATSRYGESFYMFLPRTFIYSLISAFKIEYQKSKILNNRVIQMWSFTLVSYALIAWFNSHILVAWILVSVMAIFLLELVNYIEHYGIVRKSNDKSYEKVTPIHSWNSDHFFSRVHIFELSRHSDHHANATKPFYNLESIEHSPQMPTGYPGMMLIALIPPLWFKIMNKKIENYQPLSMN